MKKNIKIVLSILMMLSFIALATCDSKATTATTMTVKEYIAYQIKGCSINEPTYPEGVTPPAIEAVPSKYIKIARMLGIVKKAEFNYNKKITRQQAVVLANRIDEYKYGKNNHDKSIYTQIKSKKRISDISKAISTSRTDLYEIFAKGIFVGDSNGKCSQSRKFQPTKKLTVSESKTILSRLKSKSKRKKISPDGQLIRTTKLPKNYKSFPYILQSFPNSFYEKAFSYQVAKYYKGEKRIKPVEYNHYIKPVNIRSKKAYFGYGYTVKQVLDKYQDKWMKKVETNLRTRLSFNYKTVDKNNKKWLYTLRDTYYKYNRKGSEASDARKTNDIKKYIKAAKKNKVILECKEVRVEPSTLYLTYQYRVRVYVKFRVKSMTKVPADKSKLIYGDYYGTIKKGKWIEGYYEIGLATTTMGSDGHDYAVYYDYLAPLPALSKIINK